VPRGNGKKNCSAAGRRFVLEQQAWPSSPSGDQSENRTIRPVPEAKTTRLKEKIAKFREEIERLNALNTQMMASEDEQISLTYPDARSMATTAKAAGWSKKKR
jgi:hypothetical protein